MATGVETEGLVASKGNSAQTPRVPDEIARVLRILVVERRPLGTRHVICIYLADRLGIRATPAMTPNGFIERVITLPFFTFNETRIDFEGVTFGAASFVICIGANQGFFTFCAASKASRDFAFNRAGENLAMFKDNIVRNRLQFRTLALSEVTT